MTGLAKKLPMLWNAHMGTGIAVAFVLIVLGFQMIPGVDYGEAEWGLIGVVATKLMDAVMKIVSYYTNGEGE